MADTRQRYVRIDDDTWARALARAQREDTNVSAVIREHVTDYANEVTGPADELRRIIRDLRKLLQRLQS